MKAFMFPGQGAQRLGMGASLFEAFPELTRTADQVLGYSIQSLCADGPIEQLTRTEYTQPALFVVNALSCLQRVGADGAPDYLMGHSISEYVALFAAGVFDFETGLRLVQKRGALMAGASGGGMAAVLGLDEQQVQQVLAANRLEGVFAANVNTPRQIVLSGAREAVEASEPLFMQAGASFFKMLQVSGAFHTPFMAPARDEFARFLQEVRFAAPLIPVISNVTARPHDALRIRESMVEQITAPVRWADSIRYLMAKGLAVNDFEEVGPQGMAVVKPMVMRTRNEAGPLDAALLALEEAQQHAREPAGPQVQMQALEPEPVAAPPRPFTAASLGAASFCELFGVRHAYVAGGMYQGIASVDVVARLAGAGLMGFLGAGGLKLAEIENAIVAIQERIAPGAPYGINFIAHSNHPAREDELTDLLLVHGVRTIEASAFMEVTPALVRYRARGLQREAGGRVLARNRIIAKVSRPDVAAQFFAPAPPRLVARLLEAGAITADEAAMLAQVPMADALSVEADSGGHTDQGMPFTLIPAMLRLRDSIQPQYSGFGRLFVGAGGGIGTPEAAAAAFVMGVDFILTGSINQCTPEAGTSALVKDLLQEMQVHDTDYAPSGDLFEQGSKVQVLKKGIFFPARANKLASLYRQHESLDELDPKTRQQIEERYFRRSLDTVYGEVRAACPPGDLERAERSSKHRMAMVFKRYFRDATDWALAGDAAHKVDFQIQCGPALGAFNQWVAGTELAPWQARHVDVVADRLMTETAALLRGRFAAMQAPGR
jgi:trans-AT polyketide synthase/acyltransferase/oxidoreductase domain-containing protein